MPIRDVKPQINLITLLSAIFYLMSVYSPVSAQIKENERLLFDTSDHGDPGTSGPVVKAWKHITLDTWYGGLWVVTGDVDGDGAVDIVSAKNFNEDDVHHTSSVVAQRLDGSVIWRWGDPSVGRREWHHDVACQIYDWNNDGKNEVILCTKGYLVHIDGATGKEIRRLPIEEDATDCLVFCNLSGALHAGDVLVKNRYKQIWAYTYAGTLIWTVSMPGGYRTSHQPVLYDIDGDGTDEILAGYAMLNADGSVRWTLSSDAVDLNKGHLDCCRLLKKGDRPEDYRFVMTYCGANCIACVDGNGSTVWKIPGYHFESLNVGNVFPDSKESNILVDIDHVPEGDSPVWVFDENGFKMGQLVSDYCRHHKLLDWTGDGFDEIILANARGVFDSSGKRIATFDCDGSGVAMQLGDMTGDGRTDVAITTESSVYIFANTKGIPKSKPVKLGCGVNFTFY
ncbi:MAG: hypothetical protein JXB48_07880 [Candidatus Latescibacteria bacterium]|nr:hypothetical protein [Candidatus Latescibacterota bacterium]